MRSWWGLNWTVAARSESANLCSYSIELQARPQRRFILDAPSILSSKPVC